MSQGTVTHGGRPRTPIQYLVFSLQLLWLPSHWRPWSIIRLATFSIDQNSRNNEVCITQCVPDAGHGYRLCNPVDIKGVYVGRSGSCIIAACWYCQYTPANVSRADARNRPLNQAWKNWNSRSPPRARSMSCLTRASDAGVNCFHRVQVAPSHQHGGLVDFDCQWTLSAASWQGIVTNGYKIDKGYGGCSIRQVSSIKASALSPHLYFSGMFLRMSRTEEMV